MSFNHFLEDITRLQDKPLGGKKSQFKLAPKLRIDFPDEKIAERNPKIAAVLALFYPDKENNTHFLLTLRASYKGAHSAQISFPGGKTESNDKNLQETALRETFEETGIPAKDIKIIKQLSDTYIPPSNFLVSPFLGYIDYTPEFTPNEEVESFIEINKEKLLNNNNLIIKNMSTSYMKNIDVPCFQFNDFIVWGATAMILSEIKDLLITH